MRRILWLYCFVLLVAGSAVAQTQSIGSILSYKKIPAGISGRTATAFFEVRAWADGIIRVRVSKKEKGRDFSYALLSPVPPATPSVTVQEREDRILLSTPLVRVTIDKIPSFRIVFSDTLGNIINEDMAGEGFGTTFIGDKVSIYKKLQQGERFVGLGECLGNLDKRG